MPTATGFMPWTTIKPITRWWLAPNAMRTPISPRQGRYNQQPCE
jgi:hypothetical protein